MHQLGEGVFALLPAGAENAGQYLMRAGTVGRTIASPGFASHRHQPDGPLGEVIGGMQARTAQKREQMGLLMAQVFGQSLVVRAAKVSIQQAVQLDFQAPTGHRQAMRGNLALLVAISQSEALRQQGFNRQGELGGCGGGHLDHLATAPDQVLQAALMKRLCKPIETSRSVMHQKTGVVRSQNRRRLGIPTMRFNHVNGDLFAQQHPQILRTCAYSPAGVVQPYHGALPQLTLQLLVGGRRQIPQSRQGPAYPTPAPLQPVAQFQHPRRARVRQPNSLLSTAAIDKASGPTCTSPTRRESEVCKGCRPCACRPQQAHVPTSPSKRRMMVIRRMSSWY